MTDLLVQTLLQDHPDQAAIALEGLAPSELSVFFEQVPASSAAKVMCHLSKFQLTACFNLISEQQAVALLAKLPATVCAQLLQQTPSKRRRALKQQLPLSVSLAVKTLQGYPEGTVGSLMDPLASTLPPDITVEVAIKRLKQSKQPLRHLVFIVDGESRLIGYINSSDLLVKERQAMLDNFLLVPVHRLLASTSVVSLNQHPGWVHQTLLPVVDRKGRFLGTLSQDRVVKFLSDPIITLPYPGTSALLEVADRCWILLARLISPPTRPPTGNQEPISR